MLVEDATFFVDEEAGALVAAVFTGVVIFNGETCEARKSLSTLLIIESVWENIPSVLIQRFESNNSSKDNFSLKWLNLFKIIPCKKIKTLTKSRENNKSTLSFKKPFKRLNKEISKNLTINDLQHEINIIKQEISELKNKNKNPMPKDSQTD